MLPRGFHQLNQAQGLDVITSTPYRQNLRCIHQEATVHTGRTEAGVDIGGAIHKGGAGGKSFNADELPGEYGRWGKL